MDRIKRERQKTKDPRPKKEYEGRNFAHFARIYPAKQGFALFAVNGFLF